MERTERWVPAALLADLPEPEEGGLEVTVEGIELALFRDGERVHALENACPHRGAALAEGRCAGGEVVCPWHGWRFALGDGSCHTLPDSMPAKVFPVRLREGVVEVRLQ